MTRLSDKEMEEINNKRDREEVIFGLAATGYYAFFGVLFFIVLLVCSHLLGAIVTASIFGLFAFLSYLNRNNHSMHW